MPATQDILIIDDEDSIVDFMTEVLKDEGYTVRSAIDGAQGLSEMVTAPPALVLLDLHMPGMTVMEFLEQVHTDGTYPMPIVIMTADQHAPAYLSDRTDMTFLFKPFDLDTLTQCVAQFITPPFIGEV
jgi:DNA-binding NtrC family response regulator